MAKLSSAKMWVLKQLETGPRYGTEADPYPPRANVKAYDWLLERGMVERHGLEWRLTEAGRVARGRKRARRFTKGGLLTVCVPPHWRGKGGLVERLATHSKAPSDSEFVCGLIAAYAMAAGISTEAKL